MLKIGQCGGKRSHPAKVPIPMQAGPRSHTGGPGINLGEDAPEALPTQAGIGLRAMLSRSRTLCYHP